MADPLSREVRPMRVNCPTCNSPITAPATAAGKVAKCPSCGERVRLPALPPPAPQKAAKPVRPAVEDADDVPPQNAGRSLWPLLAGAGITAAVAAVAVLVVVLARGGGEQLPAPPPTPQPQVNAEAKKDAAEKAPALAPPKVEQGPDPQRAFLESEKERLEGSLSRIRKRIAESARTTAQVVADTDKSLAELAVQLEKGRKYLATARPLIEKPRVKVENGEVSAEDYRDAKAKVDEQERLYAQVVDLIERNGRIKAGSQASHQRLVDAERDFDRQLKEVVAKLAR
jgi:hypothetical protein